MQKRPSLDDMPDTLSVPEAAEVLGIGLTKAYGLAKTGEIPAIWFGRRVRIPKVGLKRMLEETGCKAVS